MDSPHQTQPEKPLPEACAGCINRKGNRGRERRSAFPRSYARSLTKPEIELRLPEPPPWHDTPGLRRALAADITFRGDRHPFRARCICRTERHLHSFQELEMQQKGLGREVPHSSDDILILFSADQLPALFWTAVKGFVLQYRTILSPPM